MKSFKNYSEWGKTVPENIKGASVWKSTAYSLALFVADLAWRDATKPIGKSGPAC